MGLKADYRGELAQRARVFLNRTQKEMAALFGLSLRSWQDKEQNTNRVSVSETYMLLLLLNEHPDYQLLPRIDDAKTPAKEAAKIAVELAQCLTERIPLPSKVVELENALDAAILAFREDFVADMDNGQGDLSPVAYYLKNWKRPEIESLIWSPITANCGLNWLKIPVNQAPFGSPSTGRVVCHTSLT